MCDDLWELNLSTLAWTKRWPPPDSPTQDSASAIPGPKPRYFHSCTSWGDHSLVVFGGQTILPPPLHTDSDSSTDTDDQTIHLDTLADLAVYHIQTDEWSFPTPTCAAGVSAPAGRYAHLAVVSSVHDSRDAGVEARARLTLLGGQDAGNKYLDERHVLDLGRMEWVVEAGLGRNVGGYRSVAVASEWTVTKGGKHGVLESSSASVTPDEDLLEPIVVFTNAGGAQ